MSGTGIARFKIFSFSLLQVLARPPADTEVSDLSLNSIEVNDLSLRSTEVSDLSFCSRFFLYSLNSVFVFSTLMVIGGSIEVSDLSVMK